MADEERSWVIELQNVDTGVTARLSAEEAETLRHAIYMAEEPFERFAVDRDTAKRVRRKFGQLCRPASEPASR